VLHLRASVDVQSSLESCTVIENISVPAITSEELGQTGDKSGLYLDLMISGLPTRKLLLATALEHGA